MQSGDSKDLVHKKRMTQCHTNHWTPPNAVNLFINSEGAVGDRNKLMQKFQVLQIQTRVRGF